MRRARLPGFPCLRGGDERGGILRLAQGLPRAQYGGNRRELGYNGRNAAARSAHGSGL